MRTQATLAALALVGTSLLTASPLAAQRLSYTSSADWAMGTSTRLTERLPGTLELADSPIRRGNVVWSDNYLYGYIVRFDASTGRQIGRYDTVLLSTPGLPGGIPPANQFCNFSSTGNCPGRVAVDQNADAYVLNRAFGQQGSVTHVASHLSRCVDRNGNGTIETSSDVNGDGLISVMPADGEYLGQNDECLLNTVAVGAPNQYPRGIAIDRTGQLWLATHNDGRLFRYNIVGGVPMLVSTINVGGNPYSMAAGGDWVYVSSSSATGTRRVNILTEAIESAPCPGTYGVVAGEANDAWLGGYFTGTGIYHANFTTGTCPMIANPGQVTAITRDPSGNIWTSNYSVNTISAYNSVGTLLGTYPAGGNNPHGMSIDSNGILWVVTHSGRMARIQTLAGPTFGSLIDTPSLAGPGVPDPDPYLYSDYTGWQLAVDAPFANNGTWVVRGDGGGPGIPWARATWNTEPDGLEFAGTTITVRVRAADTLAALGAASFVTATNGAALVGVTGRFAEIEVTLTGPGSGTPRLSDVTLFGPCMAPGETCCVAATNCNDGDVCTTDTCGVAGGMCGHASVASCCVDPNDCADDGNECIGNTCAANTCGTMPVPAGTPCTTGVCDGLGACVDCRMDSDCGAFGVCDMTMGCVGFDHDDDGVLDPADADADNDGITDLDESGGIDPSRDTDSDGTPDYADSDAVGFADTNTDGTDDRFDPDGDSVPSFLDLDADGDGIPDLDENGGLTLDVDRDGVVDAFVDVDRDGLAAAFDMNDASAAVTTTLLGVLDLDGTGGANFLDLDADGDGLFDLVEGGGADPDRDGRVAVSADANDNGLDDALDPRAMGTALTLPDADMDARRNWLDVDDDGDGVFTRFEAPDANANGSPEDARDSDRDLLADYLDVDDDGDGVLTEHESADPGGDGNPMDAQNTDSASGDSIPDYLDTDDDGDGFLTEDEAPDADGDGDPADARNTDADGSADYLDDDDDGDGIDTLVEVMDGRALTPPADDLPDPDTDSVEHWLDTDSDGDGVLDRAEQRDDLDMDGIPNYLDADSAPLDTDMDGLRDDVECPGLVSPCPDTDMDGNEDRNDPDDDGDSVPTATELPRDDTDMDGQPDYLDTDDDADGVPTADEAADDSDMDGVSDSIEPDDDDDGILTSAERPGMMDRDGDMDGLPDHRDPDDDGDGILTRGERPMTMDRDTDSDMRPDHLDPDDDGDSVPTRDERPAMMDRDTDSDMRPDHLDTDDDQDGIPTTREAADSTAIGENDVDGDGDENWLDTDSDGDGLTDTTECPMGDMACPDMEMNGRPDYLEVLAAIDAGVRDAGRVGEIDAGTGGSSGGCGCMVPRSARTAPWALAIVGLLALVATRRRRRGA